MAVKTYLGFVESAYVAPIQEVWLPKAQADPVGQAAQAVP